MDAFIDTFHIDWKIIIAQAVNFVVVLVILQFLVLKPLKKVMSERTAKIEKGLEDAKKNSQILSSTKEEYEKVIAQAKQEANDLFQEAKKEAEAKKTQMLDDAKAQVASMIETGKKTLESEKSRMMEEVKTEIVDLTIQATEKILKSASNGKVDESVIKNINNLG